MRMQARLLRVKQLCTRQEWRWYIEAVELTTPLLGGSYLGSGVDHAGAS